MIDSQEDIGRPKAVVAHETITSSLYEGMKRSNVPITFESHVMKVDIDSEKMFNQTFWQGLDVVVSALVSEITLSRHPVRLVNALIVLYRSNFLIRFN